MFFRVYNVFLMAISETRPGKVPGHEAQGKLLITRAEDFVHGLVKKIYPGIPEDNVELIARNGIGVKFSGTRTDASWSIERQANVDRRDARPSVHLGIALKRDRRGRATGIAEIYVGAGGRMMDAPPEMEMDPVRIARREHPVHESEEAVLQELGATMLSVWEVLEDVAGEIPVISDPNAQSDMQTQYERLINELRAKKQAKRQSGHDITRRRWERNTVEPI